MFELVTGILILAIIALVVMRKEDVVTHLNTIERAMDELTLIHGPSLRLTVSSTYWSISTHGSNEIAAGESLEDLVIYCDYVLGGRP